MTLAELNQKPDDELNVMLAELRGWKRPEHPDAMRFKQGWSMPEKWWLCPKGVLRFKHDIPNYTASLDACAEVRAVLSRSQQRKFTSILAEVIAGKSHEGRRKLLPTFDLIHAKPRHQTIALIAALDAARQQP